jgi:hypothetical protein
LFAKEPEAKCRMIGQMPVKNGLRRGEVQPRNGRARFFLESEIACQRRPSSKSARALDGGRIICAIIVKR